MKAFENFPHCSRNFCGFLIRFFYRKSRNLQKILHQRTMNFVDSVLVIFVALNCHVVQCDWACWDYESCANYDSISETGADYIECYGYFSCYQANHISCTSNCRGLKCDGSYSCYQVKNLEVSNPNMCLIKFKSNNLLGLIVFINILIGKII